jgi:hypothetical protein
MKIGISNILYLAFRLAPFIIVCYFILQSLLNWDLKGLVYLVGLIFASVLSILFGNNGITNKELIDIPNPRCYIITLDEGKPLSNIPLSIVTFSYTFFYLFIFMINLANNATNGVFSKNAGTRQNLNMIIQQNTPMLILFPLLIILEIFWIMANNCIVQQNWFISILSAILIGGGVGVGWAMFVTYLKKPELQYINKSGLEVCSQPSKTLYRCRPKNNSGGNL